MSRSTVKRLYLLRVTATVHFIVDVRPAGVNHNGSPRLCRRDPSPSTRGDPRSTTTYCYSRADQRQRIKCTEDHLAGLRNREGRGAKVNS
jgi:hypothetical protein